MQPTTVLILIVIGLIISFSLGISFAWLYFETSSKPKWGSDSEPNPKDDL